MKLIKVESSFIAAIGYENNTLEVVLLNKKAWRYKNVPEKIFTDFLKAKSKGSFFTRKIKRHFTEAPVNRTHQETEYLLGQASTLYASAQ